MTVGFGRCTLPPTRRWRLTHCRRVAESSDFEQRAGPLIPELSDGEGAFPTPYGHRHGSPRIPGEKTPCCRQSVNRGAYVPRRLFAQVPETSHRVGRDRSSRRVAVRWANGRSELGRGWMCRVSVPGGSRQWRDVARDSDLALPSKPLLARHIPLYNHCTFDQHCHGPAVHLVSTSLTWPTSGRSSHYEGRGCSLLFVFA